MNTSTLNPVGTSNKMWTPSPELCVEGHDCQGGVCGAGPGPRRVLAKGSTLGVLNCRGQYVSYSRNSLDGVIVGDYIGDYYRGYS